MSFFANQSVAGSHPSIHHFRVNSSQYGSIIPIVYGRARIPGIFIWTGDFSATKSHGPGKGLGGTGGSFYTYSVSVEIALSQGPIASLGRSWHMGNGGLKRHTAAQTNSNWTLFSGAFGQMPWSYMTSKHPGQDLGYSGVAYLARSAWNLGTTGSPPQITFEVFGLAPYGSGVSDANPRDVIGDILINPRYGLGLAPSCLADSADFSNYCVANSFFISPVFDQQKTMAEWIKLLLDCVHADAVWSNGQLKIVPYGDRPVAGNGATWIPSVGPVYVLGDDDFMAEKNSAPVTVSVTTPADRANVVNVEYINAANDYNIETVEAKDEADIQRLGQRRDAPRRFHPITNALMARSVAQLKLQRSLCVANQYEVRVPQRYILAEPMDVIALSDEYLGLDCYPARIVEIQEEADDAGQLTGDSLLITLEDLGANSTPGYPTQPPGPWGAVDQNTAPNPINVNPIIFEPPAKALGNHGIAGHLKGALELWVAASPQDADADWGGCNVYLSADNNTYSPIGRIRNAAAMGALAAPLPSHPDPDLADTLQVDLSESGGSLTAASHALADSGMNLAYVDGELICFADVAAGAGPNQFDLGYLRRGRYGSAIRSHAAGAGFAFLGAIHSLDPSILRIPLTNAHIGQTLYLKFASVNTEIDSEQELSTCAAYTVTIAGAAHQNRIPHRHVKKYRAATFYSAGAYVKPNSPNGFFYQAQNSGTSGGSEPQWPVGIDASVTDSGGITWTAIEASPEIDDGSIPTSVLDNTPLPDVTGLAYAITKKGDIRLSWSFTTPRPSNFSHFEIRQGSSWAGGTLLDTTKRNQLLITDPAPGTSTYWVGAINVALAADPSPPSISVTMPAPAPVTGLTATITKKGDVKLAWTKPSPFPAHFAAYEIRTDTNPGNAANLVDHTKKTSYQIVDPPPGSTTYYVYVLDHAGNYSSAVSVMASPAAPPAISGLSATVTRKKDLKLSWNNVGQGIPHFKAYEIRTDTNWGGTANLVAHTKQDHYTIIDLAPASPVTYYVAALDMAGNYGAAASVSGSISQGFTINPAIHLWSGLAADTASNTRMLPAQRTSAPATGTATSGTYGGDWEVSFQAELGANGEIELYQSDGLGHGYLLQVGAVNGRSAAVARWNGSIFDSDLAVAPGAYPPAIPLNVIFKRHGTGHFEIYVNGAAACQVQDNTYGAAGPLYLMYSGAVCYVSNLVVRGGHADTPKVYKDSNKRALIDFTQGGHLGKHLGNVPDDAGSHRAAIHSSAIDSTNTPKRSWLKLWSGFTIDTADGNRYAPPIASNPSGTLATTNNVGYGGDWECSFQVEIGSNVDLYHGDGTGNGFGHAYLFEFNTTGVAFYRWDGSAFTALGGASMSVSGGVHNVIAKRHNTGHFEFYFDGALILSVQDTTYGVGGPLGMAQNASGSYVSSVVVRGGHTDTPKAYKDPNKRALIDFTQGGHAGKHLGNIPDDTTSSGGRRKAHTVDLLANRPAAGNAGALFHAIDAGANGTTYRDTGTGWKKVGAGHLDDLDEGTTYSRTLASAQTGNVPNKPELHLWTGLTLRPDGKTIGVPTQGSAPSLSAVTSSSYGLDWEVSFVVQLGANSAIALFHNDNNSGAGYYFQVGAGTLGCGIYRYNGASYTALATAGAEPSGAPFSVVIKRHSSGHLELWVNGTLIASATDSTYTHSGEIAIMQEGSNPVLVSALKVRGGHFDLPQAYQNPINKKLKKGGIDSKTITNAEIAAGAITQAATNSASGTAGSPLATISGWGPNAYSPWTSLVSTSLNIANSGDIVECTCTISVELIGYTQGNDDVEVRITDDLNNVICTPQLAIGDFTRVQGQTDPTTYGGAGTVLKVLSGIDFGSAPSSGSRNLTLQIRGYHSAATTFNMAIHYARLAAKDFGA